MADKTLGALTFGFDIGIASVGWCVLGENRIIDLGVRCFDKAETAKEGESLNLARRTARLMRRRLRRRAWRLTKLARLLKREGLIAEVSRIHDPSPVSPWHLRVEGLDRRLTDDEWAHAIYHLCKHRGFHWISRAEKRKAESDAKEGGRVKKGLFDTQRRMTEMGYRSAAEMVLAEFPDAQRNKQGDYGKALSRILLSDELALLFRHQRELGNTHAGNELEAAILGSDDRKSGLFWQQHPAISGEELLSRVGWCTFERDQRRAPRASFTAERHVWLTRLNNLRIVFDGSTRPLNETEHRFALPLPYKQAGDFTYKQLRAALTKAGLLPDSFKFAGLSYPTGRQLDDPKAKDPESEKLVKLPAWQELRRTLKDKSLETEWEGMAGAATGGNPELLDEIARVLSVFKDGDEVAAELHKLDLSGGKAMIDALSEISFDKFHALSLKALRKIVPHMESGLRYDEACAAAGYHHSQLHAAGAGDHKYLPPLYSRRDKDGRMVFNEELDVPRNPVVLRALNQARKVLNALVRTYGSPVAVHIEMARDLSRPLNGYFTDNGKRIDGRRDIEAKQKEYRERNNKDKAAFAAEHGIAAKSREFEKFQLYREQQGKCAYSLKPLDLHRVLHDIGYAEVDHALPYSRSYDDSKNNKVLALTEENRNKGNRTAYEYLTSFPCGENGERWRNFAVSVETNKAYRLAKRTRLLRKDFGGKAADEFRERNLNDTRYICRFFKNYVEQYLQLAPKVGAGGTAETTAKRCVVLSGQTTAFLRARWGLLKVRGANDRHHALDATVVAACSHSMVQRLTRYSKEKELAKVREGFPDPETGEIINPAMYQQLHAHFPDPWPHFRSELEARLNIDDSADLRARMEMFGTYAPEVLETLRPLFVSRAPQRRNSGAAHKDTIYGKPRHDHRLQVIDKKAKTIRDATKSELTSLAIERIGAFETKDQGKQYKLTLDRLGDIVGLERNEWMVDGLRLWISKRGDDPKKPGTRDFPRKPKKCDAKDGPFTGPEIKAVKVNAGKVSGIPVRHGVATNDTMLRVDVFRHKKDGKFHLVPVYVYHAVAKTLPNRAIVAFKDENDWTQIDNQDFDFCFSAYPNDYLRVSLKHEILTGYFAGCDRSTGNVGLWAHDRNSSVGKDGLIRTGVKTGIAFEKFHVDVLGNIYPAPLESRLGLA